MLRATSGLFAAAAAAMVAAVLTGCGSSDKKATPQLPTPPASVLPSMPGGTGGGSTEASGAPAAPSGKGITMDENGGGAGPQLCAMFSAEQASELLGVTVGKGEAGGPLSSLCTWSTGDDEQSLQIQMVPGDQYAPDKGDGYAELPGVADEAAISPGAFGEWSAWALVQDRATVVVSVRKSDGAADTAAQILKSVMPQLLPAR